jgi:hypothetical protein
MAEPHDDQLAAELRALGTWVATPEPPDVRAAVRARLANPPQSTVRAKLSNHRHRTRWLAAAAALLLAIVIAVVPQSRAAVAHAVTGVLRFAGVEVHKGQPHVAPSPSPLPSTRSTGLDEARRQARFPVTVPARLGVPDEVLTADPAPDGAPRVVSLLYRKGTIRLDEFDGDLAPGFVKTQSGPDTEWTDIKGSFALWLPHPHAVVYVDRAGVQHEETARLAGTTLIWSDGRVSYRLEGVPTMAEAVAIAASMAP